MQWICSKLWGSKMPSINEIYRCEICHLIMDVVHAGSGNLVCCGQSMKLQEENKVDAAEEKHVPVVERDGNQVKVRVGSVLHPMDPDHYIEWIEINMVDAGRVAKRFLKPGDAPEVEFHVRGEMVKIRAYCNLHGLWSGGKK